MSRRSSSRTQASMVVFGLLVAACSSGASNGSDDASSTTEPAVTTTTVAPVYTASVVGETVVSPGYRQGVARVDDGWVFSLNDALFRTDDAFVETLVVTPAVPPPFATRGFDHVGDIDVVDGVVYASLEQPDYETGTQAMAMYDAGTLMFIDGIDVAQHHNLFVTVDPDSGIAYSMDGFGGQALVRYDTRDNWRALAPIAMSTYLDKVQGGDIVDGAVWLSTDDATEGVYRVDVDTGAVQSLGSIGHVDGEGEGIDATALPSGDLHVLSVDVAVVPVRVVDLKVTKTSAG